MIQPPAYVDGRFRLFKIEADESSDFPVEKLRDTKMDIWFSEISVFDRTRYELGRSGIGEISHPHMQVVVSFNLTP